VWEAGSKHKGRKKKTKDAGGGCEDNVAYR